MPRYTLTGTVEIVIEAADKHEAKVKMTRAIKELTDAGETLLAGERGFAEARLDIDVDNVDRVM